MSFRASLLYGQEEKVEMQILVSPFQNPYVNLAIEDFFLREQRGDLPLLLFYVNRPCVVFGRFQNPWLESQLSYLAQNDLWPVRRQSGGGTVFHDGGNLNYCLITEKAMVDKGHAVGILKQALSTLGVEAIISERYDLFCLDPKDGIKKKISGSAYKQTKDSSFHHGTLLIDSDLERLQRSLEASASILESKSIPSVRSKVMTLSQLIPGLNMSHIVESVEKTLGVTGRMIPEQFFYSSDLIAEKTNYWGSHEWIFGETPQFEIELNGEMTKVYKGKVGELAFSRENFSHLPEELLNRLFPDFSEQRKYCSLLF